MMEKFVVLANYSLDDIRNDSDALCGNFTNLKICRFSPPQEKNTLSIFDEKNTSDKKEPR